MSSLQQNIRSKKASRCIMGENMEYRITIRMTKEQWDFLKSEQNRTGNPPSSIVRHILSEHMKKYELEV